MIVGLIASLGFDPFDEYNKGLADLLAAERAQASNEHAAATRPTGRAAWPSTSTGNESYFANVSKDTSQQYSLFGDASPGLSIAHYHLDRSDNQLNLCEDHLNHFDNRLNHLITTSLCENHPNHCGNQLDHMNEDCDVSIVSENGV